MRRASFRHRSMTSHATSSFFFNAPATTEIYTLSLHDALPIWKRRSHRGNPPSTPWPKYVSRSLYRFRPGGIRTRSEEHTSELQSHSDLVCRLLLEKKNISSTICVITS